MTPRRIILTSPLHARFWMKTTTGLPSRKSASSNILPFASSNRIPRVRSFVLRGLRARARLHWGTPSRGHSGANLCASHLAECVMRQKSEGIVALTLALCRDASFRGCGARNPIILYSCSMKSTNSAATSAATLHRRFWRFWTHSRTTPSLTTTWMYRLICRASCLLQRQTFWTPFHRLCWTGWK